MISALSGNSRILLTIDERGSWAQLYYPYPGLHQQLRESRLGLFDEASKEFTWVDHGGHAPLEVTYLEGSNAVRTRLQRLNLDLTIDDMVHPNLDLVIRRVVVKNPGNEARRLRVFHYQSLNIEGSLYQDTVYWDADRKTVTHYKRSYYFQLWGRPDFDHFACGEHTLKGLRGSYVDAEDGQLEGGLISHGAADSVVQWNLEVPASEERAVHLLVMIGGSRRLVNDFYLQLQGREPGLFVAEAVGYWNHWVANKELSPSTGLSTRVQDVYRRSLFVMRDCQATNGAIIASPDSRTLKSGGDNYNYCWWRDGSYISRAMSETGLHRGTIGFLRFAAKCQEEEGYFLHRHFPDGSVGSTWHPPPFLQIDQTASVIDAVGHYYDCSGVLDELLPSWRLVRRAADFLMSFVDERGLPRASYDLWEEKKAVNAYSVAMVIRGLRAATRVGQALAKRTDFWAAAADKTHRAALQHLWNPAKDTLFKGLDPTDETIDSSALLALLAGLLPPTDPRYAQVVRAVEERLWVQSSGGLARYEGDQYYGRENAWIICTLWLAQAHLRLGNAERCRELIEWAASKAGPTDLLPEQIDARTGEHTSVTPLVWSHSTFIETVNAYAQDRARAGPSVKPFPVRAPSKEMKP